VDGGGPLRRGQQGTSAPPPPPTAPAGSTQSSNTHWCPEAQPSKADVTSGGQKGSRPAARAALGGRLLRFDMVQPARGQREQGPPLLSACNSQCSAPDRGTIRLACGRPSRAAQAGRQAGRQRMQAAGLHFPTMGKLLARALVMPTRPRPATSWHRFVGVKTARATHRLARVKTRRNRWQARSWTPVWRAWPAT